MCDGLISFPGSNWVLGYKEMLKQTVKVSEILCMKINFRIV